MMERVTTPFQNPTIQEADMFGKRNASMSLCTGLANQATTTYYEL
jgi:hypothetical protein